MKDLLAPPGRPALDALRAPGTLVVLDFDGTIAPLVRDRTAARLTARTARLLGALAASRPVAVLSGRALADVASRLSGAPVRWVVGGHGAEWPGERPAAGVARRVAGWRRILAERLAHVQGIDVEDKALSLSIHWRGARDPAAAGAAVQRAAAGLPGAALIPGKRVLNLVPADAPDKGGALARLVAESRCARVIFVGDDVTDEAAFRAQLPVPAVMVRVGRDAGSAAAWFVRSRTDVDRLLVLLADGPSSSGASRAAENSPDPLGPVLGFMRTLWAMEHGLNRRSKEMNRRFGVTGPQRLVIRVLSQLGPISPGELAKVLHLHPASVTRLALTLERRRMVRRRGVPHDRRRILLELAPGADRAKGAAAGIIEGLVRDALAAASKREVAVARRLLEQLSERLLGR